MAFIKTTPASEAEGDVLAMYQRQQASWGYVPNYAKVFCHRPEVMTRWAKLLSELRRPMDDRRFELVTFAAAHELQHTACALAHGKALAEFVGEDGVRAIAEMRPVDALSAAEEEMVRFARKVARDASSVTMHDVEALRQHGLTEAEIFDIAGAVAGRSFFTKLLDALGVQADAPFGSMDEQVRRALIVGRPVDTAPVETMPIAE